MTDPRHAAAGQVAAGASGADTVAPQRHAVLEAATQRDPQAPAGPPLSEAWSVLARARLEALDRLFPDWRIWLDQHGWHARRRSSVYKQDHLPGAPAFYVHADNSVDLAAQLCWQRAADEHAPSGCSARSLARSRER